MTTKYLVIEWAGYWRVADLGPGFEGELLHPSPEAAVTAIKSWCCTEEEQKDYFVVPLNLPANPDGVSRVLLSKAPPTEP